MNKGVATLLIGAMVTMSVLTSQAYAGVPGTVSDMMTPPAVEDNSTNPYEVAGIEDPKQFNDFFIKLQDAVADNDKKAIADMISYPLRVNKNGHSIEIKNKSEFVKAYSRIITKKVKKKVLHQELNKLFVNSYGVRIGDGEMWISQIDGKIAIYAINL